MAKEGAPEHVGSGICAVAAAVLAAKDVRQEEYELAEKILGRKFPKNDNPRELEFAATTFNRHMDAAIDACNRSHKADTRVTRRAHLARDLDRAGLVLLDRDMVAGLIAKIRELKDELAARPLLEQAEDLGAELLTDEEQDELVDRINGTPNLHPLPARITFNNGGSIEFVDDGNGGTFAGLEFIDGVHGPIGGGMGDYSNPNVND